MKTKTDVEVIIDGKRYNLSGYESEEYLQKVASYLNGKSAELKAMPGYRNLDLDMKTILMEINLADDYFKAKSKVADLSKDNEEKDTEIFNLKHDIIELQKQISDIKDTYKTKYQNLSDQYNTEKDNLIEEQKKSVRLETENISLKKNLADEEEKVKKCQEELEVIKKRIGRR